MSTHLTFQNIAFDMTLTMRLKLLYGTSNPVELVSNPMVYET